MTEIEIVKITNNRFNRATTQNKSSILFHVKLLKKGMNQNIMNTEFIKYYETQSHYDALKISHVKADFRRNINSKQMKSDNPEKIKNLIFHSQ